MEIMLNKVLTKLGLKIEGVDRLISRNLAGVDQTKSAIRNLTQIIKTARENDEASRTSHEFRQIENLEGNTRHQQGSTNIDDIGD